MCEAPTPPSITLRSTLLIVLSFAASFVIAAAAVAMLRGSGGSKHSAAAVELEHKPTPFPNVRPWRVEVAATLSGRPGSVMVLRAPAPGGGAPSTATAKPRPGGTPGQTLRDQLKHVMGNTAKVRAVLHRFLDTSGVEAGGPADPSPDDSRTAVASASLLSGPIAQCPNESRTAPAAVIALQQVAKAPGVRDPRPHVTLPGREGDDTVVSQVAIIGGSTSRIAVAIVARAPSTSDGGDVVVTKVAGWLDRNLHAPEGYKPAC
jgi:hypothetical protein